MTASVTEIYFRNLLRPRATLWLSSHSQPSAPRHRSRPEFSIPTAQFSMYLLALFPTLLPRVWWMGVGASWPFAQHAAFRSLPKSTAASFLIIRATARFPQTLPQGNALCYKVRSLPIRFILIRNAPSNVYFCTSLRLRSQHSVPRPNSSAWILVNP